MTDLAAFVALSLAVIATPGPDTVLTIRNTLRGGRRRGIATALGVATGQLAWTVATSAGLAALLLASRPAFAAVRLLGALYLIYLGAGALRAAWRPRGGGPPVAVPREDDAGSTWAAWRQGVISNLANPKMAVFFPSLLPQFVPAGAPAFGALFLLGTLFCLMTLAWLSGYAIVIARAAERFRSSRLARVLERFAGVLLVAFGLRLATERR